MYIELEEDFIFADRHDFCRKLREMDMEHIQRINRELVVKGSIIEYYHDTMQLPDGRTSTWDFIKHNGAVAVVAVREDGKLLMVRQYRNALDRETLEIPAGALDYPEEPPMEAALRELQEETGYVGSKIEHLHTLQTTVAFTNERIEMYLVTDLKPGKQHLDEEESIDVEAYSLQELKQMILESKIQDGKTVCGILTYAAKYGLL